MTKASTMAYDDADDDDADDVVDSSSSSSANFILDERVVVIVGLGPAGLFAALSLAEEGIPTTVLERGQPVESRGRTSARCSSRARSDSNLCYGEGGAGRGPTVNSPPASDATRTTCVRSQSARRIRRAARDSRHRQTPPRHGSPGAHPPKRAGYLAAEGRGSEVRSDGGADRVRARDGRGRRSRRARRVGVRTRTNRREADGSNSNSNSDSDSDVLRPGVGGRLSGGAQREGSFRGAARGRRGASVPEFRRRVSHRTSAGVVERGAVRRRSRAAGVERSRAAPVADYRLAHQCVGLPGRPRATRTRRDGGSEPTGRACVLGCMCPGGQIVPTSTDPAELCVNDMSFSKRSRPMGQQRRGSARSFGRRASVPRERPRAANPSPAWISSDTSSVRRPSWAAAISSRPCRRRPTSSRATHPRGGSAGRVTVWASSPRGISCTRRESPRRFASLCWRSTRRFRGTRGPRRCFTRRRRGRVRPCASRDRNG